MNFGIEEMISVLAMISSGLLLVFVVDWRYFQDWIVVFLFKGLLDLMLGSPIVTLHLLEYPIRLFPDYYQTSILFELWVLPILCILYNQITRERGVQSIISYALLFSAVITAIEYFLEIYTKLIKYMQWSWLASFCTLAITFLISRSFIAFYRWGCDYFNHK